MCLESSVFGRSELTAIRIQLRFLVIVHETHFPPWLIHIGPRSARPATARSKSRRGRVGRFSGGGFGRQRQSLKTPAPHSFVIRSLCRHRCFKIARTHGPLLIESSRGLFRRPQKKRVPYALVFHPPEINGFCCCRPLLARTIRFMHADTTLGFSAIVPPPRGAGTPVVSGRRARYSETRRDGCADDGRPGTVCGDGRGTSISNGDARH